MSTIVTLLGIYSFTTAYSYEMSTSSASSSSSILDSTDTKTYTCPMHPEVISDKPGECPKCGMDLVLKENDKKKDEKNDESMDHKKCNGCMHKH
ncbi:MAG: hypothetical protein K8I03_13410 [Ignavibacteria bacterium]|nr:hypothetical protein [Ignavibacteria bacterium]